MKPTQTHPPGTPGGSPERLPALRVTVVAGPDRGLSQEVARPKLVIGRSEHADLRLTDPTVSYHHVELRSRPDGITVLDLGSKNGVRVGEMRVCHASVQRGCTLALGSTLVQIELGSEFTVPQSPATSFGSLIGQSAAMRRLYAILEWLVGNDLCVLIQGESGTGKELAARSLHQLSSRRHGPFVVLDCTAIPTGLGPSILFGHAKGAFTGAASEHKGVFEVAHGGVLFIDEVGDLPLEQQGLLLRAVQQREVTPVGSTRTRSVDIRIISATWRDLRALVNAGRFREDLYYRLAGATIYMPPLAERREDIGLLAECILRSIPSQVRAARAITGEALHLLSQRAYPGNIRELRNTVIRLASIANGTAITSSDLAFERLLGASRDLDASGDGQVEHLAGNDGSVEPFKDAKRTMIDEFERTYLSRLLERSGHNLSTAAAAAQLERHSLRALLCKHRLYISKSQGAVRSRQR